MCDIKNNIVPLEVLQVFEPEIGSLGSMLLPLGAKLLIVGDPLYYENAGYEVQQPSIIATGWPGNPDTPTLENGAKAIIPPFLNCLLQGGETGWGVVRSSLAPAESDSLTVEITPADDEPEDDPYDPLNMMDVEDADLPHAKYMPILTKQLIMLRCPVCEECEDNKICPLQTAFAGTVT